MYTPKHFEQADPQILQTVIQENPFAILGAGFGSGQPFFSHLPFLWEPHANGRGQLVFHMARANPQWRLFAKDPQVTVIFSGPHAYVTPTWYEDQTSVPTWNYVAVHVQGRVQIVDDGAAVFAIMKNLVGHFEATKPQPWRIEQAMPTWEEDVRLIVGLQIEIESWEGKFKLNQNRILPDRQNVTKNFERSPIERERELARWMRHTLEG